MKKLASGALFIALLPVIAVAFVWTTIAKRMEYRRWKKHVEQTPRG